MKTTWEERQQWRQELNSEYLVPPYDMCILLSFDEMRDLLDDLDEALMEVTKLKHRYGKEISE